ncbi:hypothetical protein GC209_04680 [bacterium]|nr:hypothetical protein [bacterium]
MRVFGLQVTRSAPLCLALLLSSLPVRAQNTAAPPASAAQSSAAKPPTCDEINRKSAAGQELTSEEYDLLPSCGKSSLFPGLPTSPPFQAFQAPEMPSLYDLFDFTKVPGILWSGQQS